MNTATRTAQRPTGLWLASATALLALAAAALPLHSQAQSTSSATTSAAPDSSAAPRTAPRPEHRADRHPDGPPRAQHAKHHGPGGPGPAGLPGGRHLQMLLEHAKATPEQRTQIEAVMQKAREDLRAQHEGGRATHQQLMQALAQPTLDTRAIESLRQQALAQHDKASQRMTQALVDAAKLLTPEQRAGLSQHLASLDHAHPGDRPQRTRAERPARAVPPAPATPGAAPATR